MKKLIILRGNSGSGKSTVAKVLQSKFGKNTMIISQDYIRMYMLNAADAESLPLMKELLIYGCNNSAVVILEGIMDSDFYKPLFELAVELYRDNIYAYYFDLPFEETFRRHMTKPNRNDFGETEMRRWWKEKDYSSTLKESIITADMSIDVIVTEIIENIY